MSVEVSQKLYKVGKSRAMTVPLPWIRHIEKRARQKFERVLVVTHEDRLEVFPDFSEEPEESESKLPKRSFKRSEEDEGED